MIALVAAATLLQAKPYLNRVVVVINGDSPTSLAIGADYLKQRGLKERLVVHCQDSALAPDKESIPFAAFKDAIELPLRTYLAKHPAIDFIVLTKGIPIRLIDAPIG